jgi:hypothetical protein
MGPDTTWSHGRPWYDPFSNTQAFKNMAVCNGKYQTIIYVEIILTLKIH